MPRFGRYGPYLKAPHPRKSSRGLLKKKRQAGSILVVKHGLRAQTQYVAVVRYNELHGYKPDQTSTHERRQHQHDMSHLPAFTSGHWPVVTPTSAVSFQIFCS